MNALKKYRFCPVCGSNEFKAAGVKSLCCKNCGFEMFINASASYVALIYNDKGELLVVRRRCEPAKGTLDLPGGFADAGETAEEGVMREVREETGLAVDSVRFLFSLPNLYEYSGLDIPTLDLFFACEVSDTSVLCPGDDAEEAFWIVPDKLDPKEFGLRSISKGIEKLKEKVRRT